MAIAVGAAVAGGSGGDFTEDDIEDMEKAELWIDAVGVKRGYCRPRSNDIEASA
jgi:hypothetical protein